MTVRLTIDEQIVEVENGATILDAARKLGIEIPTLCHMDGIPPASSCLLCVVRVDGRRNLVPSCAATAEEGMVVTTRSDEIIAARKTALELLLSDHVGDCVAPCTLACPAGMDIPAMIKHIRKGQHSEALAVIREHIALPGVLGRICPRFCEHVCRRKDIDQPIAICALKRFPADHVKQNDNKTLRKPATGKKVAIIGTGPAGLSCAYFLLREGHACTLLDSNAEPGGRLRYAIPTFRLPRKALDNDINTIKTLGANFQLSSAVTDAEDFAKLRSEFDAVVVATGACASEADNFAGTEVAIQSSEFLHHCLSGERLEINGPTVILGDSEDAVDAARVALRLGATNVTLVSGKSREAMPCFSELVDAAEQEGVHLVLNSQPLRITKNSSGNHAVTYRHVDEEFVLDASSVIIAPKRLTNLAILQSWGLDASLRGEIIDRNTFATSTHGVFAVGEVATGPAATVRTVRNGRLAAIHIHRCLQGITSSDQTKPVYVRMDNLTDTERNAFQRGSQDRTREPQNILPPDRRRKTFDEVVSGFGEQAALREASRCMQCDCLAKDSCKLREYATEYGASPRAFRGARREFMRDTSHPEVIYEPGKCIMCGLCVRIAAKAGEDLGVAFLGRGFSSRMGIPFGETVEKGLPGIAVRCAMSCPTGALALKPKDNNSTE